MTSAFDAIFWVAKTGSYEQAKDRYKWTITYGSPGEADVLRESLARALGLPMETEAEREKSTKKLVKPALLKLGNGHGQCGEPLEHAGMRLNEKDLGQTTFGTQPGVASM